LGAFLPATSKAEFHTFTKRLISTTGDLSRFESPRMLMGYLGLVPSEHSSGGTVRRGGITKTGNREARRMLIEAAWSYRYPARIAKEKAEILVRLQKNIRDIAWKAQTRICTRYRTMIARGKKRPSSSLRSLVNLPASSGLSVRK
jgi:transposase